MLFVNSFGTLLDVQARHYHSLAVGSEGQVAQWGLSLSDTGQFNSRPVIIQSLSNIVRVASGHAHSLALSGNGTVFGWGG